MIARRVEHLTRILEDLLDVARISRGKIQLQRGPADLVELVRCTAEDHRSIFAARGMEFGVTAPDEPVWLDVDRRRIGQAIANLLVNAAKFTNPGGRVEIAIERRGDREAVVRVADTGIGIAPEVMPRVFDPFVLASTSLERTQGGLGLGLALVKGIVELHGGSVEARSEGLSRGAEFTIRLPVTEVQPASATVAPAASSVASRPGSRRVLVIEDNRDAADTLREVMLSVGHDVEVAYDGREGIEKARAYHPDVVLCDIGLPIVDGYEVARALRADPSLSSTYLVALTGYALLEDTRRAFSAGFNRHLAKPSAIEKIQEIVSLAPLSR